MITYFNSLLSGQDVSKLTLENDDLTVGILTYGASVQSLIFRGQPVVLSSDNITDYLDRYIYCGAIVGRVANRIAHARATVNGNEHSFDENETTGNCLHGGDEGSSQQVWSVLEHGPQHAVLTLEMVDGHMGFPGHLKVQVRYQLFESTLCVEITATTDRETLCTFAPHIYWNLSGQDTINAHVMQINAEHYLPTDENNVPTGQIAPMSGTRFDFRETRALGATALDHNFCVSHERETLRPVLRLVSELSGISLEVASTESGVQVYDGRHIDRSGLAIEPQVWPDAINHKGFPNMVLKPEDTYKAVTEFKLSQRART
jgi:aldose 1-epimerase